MLEKLGACQEAVQENYEVNDERVIINFKHLAKSLFRHFLQPKCNAMSSDVNSDSANNKLAPQSCAHFYTGGGTNTSAS